jgi:hypothetical protein
MRFCEARDCLRRPRGRFCAYHSTRLRAGRSVVRTLVPRGLEPADRHLEVCLVLLESEGDEDYERARARWLQSACELAASLGWEEPPPETMSVLTGMLRVSALAHDERPAPGQPGEDPKETPVPAAEAASGNAGRGVSSAQRATPGDHEHE